MNLSRLKAEPDSRDPASLPRLALPPQQLREEYEAIVIGSGYGASVMAARLSGHFKSLCVLERGREWMPGEFPSTSQQQLSAMRGPLNPLGLFDFTAPAFGDMDILCGNGLGGTSLINAAISVRPERTVFSLPHWPLEIQEAARNGELDSYYERAESVLLPRRNSGNASSAKSELLKRLAKQDGRKWNQLALNTRAEDFPAGKRNEYGFPQGACIQCGDCCTGCNFGAKNTLVTNYLALARKRGAEIFTQMEVVAIEKDAHGYLVHVHRHGQAGETEAVLRSKWVFLGAGSKGSSELLLRSRSDNFHFSQALGTRVSANGDVMGLAYNTESQSNILGMGRDPEALSAANRPGTIITGYIDYRRPSMKGDVESQFLLLDGVVPSSLKNVAARALVSHAQTHGFPFSDAQSARMTMDFLSPKAPSGGALNHSMLFFACGHDSSGGRYLLPGAGSPLQMKWKGVLEEPTFRRINDKMRQLSEKMGALFIPNPRSTVFGHRIQATHPLGGCVMGQNSVKGVVDHRGKVFDGRGGFHEGLYVVDAAIIPHSLAATPLLTITALAERIADLVLKG